MPLTTETTGNHVTRGCAVTSRRARSAHPRRPTRPPSWPWALALAACLTSLVPQAAPAQTNTLELPKDAAPLTILLPTFPADATAPSDGVRVKVTGTVRADGSFAPQDITADGDHPLFVAAVKDVVAQWRFLPAVDRNRCVPVDGAGQMSVWFSGSAAAPRIEVSHPKPGASPKDRPPPFRLYSERELAYAGNVQGMAKVLILIGADGRVQATAVRFSTPPGYFDEALLSAASITRVRWMESPPDTPVCFQREYRMCGDPRQEPILQHPSCNKSE